MKKGKLLNADIISVMAQMGHTDEITLSDAGLPIPIGVKRIDLALKKGVPSFIETLEVIKHEMIIEKVILADEIKVFNPALYEKVVQLFDESQIEWVSHEAFKLRTKLSKAVIRTGECTSYANIILCSGVDFEGDAHA
jgi:D-ribose pyranase